MPGYRSFLPATLAAASLFAQQPGAGNDPNASARSTTSPTFSDIVRPIFLTGKVVLEDGSVPPDRVTIERTCQNTRVPEGVTDSKGRFNIELGRRSAMLVDASTADLGDTQPNVSGARRQPNSSMMGNQTGGLSERDLMSCEIRAALPGYSSAPVILAGRRLLDNPDIGTIILRPLSGVAGFTYSATTGLASKDARKAFEKGTGLLTQKKFVEAQKELEKAVADSPKFAAAWSSLGEARMSQSDVPGAMDAFAKSAAADERFVTPHLQMMAVHAQRNEWADAARESDRVIQLNPVQFPQAFYIDAAANFNLKNYDRAEKSAREAVRLDEQHRTPRAEYLLGLLLARRNENAEAAQVFKSYMARAQGAELEAAQKQLAEVESRQASAPRQ